MHCVDGKDYSIFAMLPPANNLLAQVIKKGDEPELINSGISVSYQAYPSLDGKMNTTSNDKSNFWEHAQALFGQQLSENEGLQNQFAQNANAQAMSYNSATKLWEANAIPTFPTNNDGTTNYYPLVKVSVKDSDGNILSQTTTVLPVSDEMNCKSCHASNSLYSEAKPQSGWENNSDSDKDYKLNILKLHDQKHSIKSYLSALAQKGYSYEESLYDTAKGGTPILCASCHKSNGLGTSGIEGILALTQALHEKHAKFETTTTRESCYQCHPGQSTQCLRGAMGSAKESDGSYSMECQSCHGSMNALAAHNREGWVDEPDCQSCHYDGKREVTAVTDMQTGTLRSTLFSDTKVFQTNTGKLFKDSKGHGDLQCAVCHGSAHAIYPSSKEEDNLQNERIQGYAGTLSKCSSCHNSMVYTSNEGPHGLHQIGEDWVRNHERVAEREGTQSCALCHGSDYRGTALSKMFETRTLDRKTFTKGQQVGCYDCHNGPSGH